MHIVVVGEFLVYIWSNLIRMKLDCQPPEARVYTTFVNIDGHAEIVVRIAGTLQVEIDFVDGKGKVRRVDGYEDIAAMFVEARGAGLWFRVTGTNEDAVKDRLYPSCSLCRVRYCSIWGQTGWTNKGYEKLPH